MTNEIKEILELNNGKYVVCFPKKVIKAFKNIDNELSVCSNELPKILDYINNLQEEIMWLKDTIQDKNDCIGAYDCIIEDRDKRIDKAIKYCEESSKTIKSEYFSDVIKILKGDE